MAGMMKREVLDPMYTARQRRTEPAGILLTCMYSMGPSSGGSRLTVTLEAGCAFGATDNNTFRRELVITREPIETNPSYAC